MNDSSLLDLYYKLFQIRSLEEMIAFRYSEQKMRCPTHLSTGQEGVAAAFSLAVRKNDFAVSTHRGHAHYLAKGGSLKSLVAEIYGKKTGCSSGKGGSMHLIDLDVNFMGTSAIVGNSIPLGVGLGLSSKIKKSEDISFIFLGDGAIEEGVFYESVNFSILKELPVIFICENNLYSVYSGLDVRQPKERKISNMVSAMGIESTCCDGNNAIESFNIIQEKIEKVRKNSRPQFLEFSTYRWREHCGPNFDNDIGYRSKSEYLEWKKKDPLIFVREIISNKSHVEKVEKKVQKEIEEAFEFAEKSPFPDLSEALHGVYAEK